MPKNRHNYTRKIKLQKKNNNFAFRSVGALLEKTPIELTAIRTSRIFNNVLEYCIQLKYISI